MGNIINRGILPLFFLNGEWIGFTKDDLETVDEWYTNIGGYPEYSKEDFVEIASDEDGFVTDVSLKEKTVEELLEISK